MAMEAMIIFHIQISHEKEQQVSDDILEKSQRPRRSRQGHVLLELFMIKRRFRIQPG